MKKKNHIKTKYKEFTIEVNREKCLAGYDLTYYNVMRDDGLYIIDSFTEGDDSVEDMVKYMKNRVDEYYKDPSQYLDEEDLEWINEYK